MAKIELKGYILTVNQPETVGDKNTPKQTIIFKVPGYVDSFGDKVGRDEEWPLDVIGDNVEKLGLRRDLEGKKAKVIVYVSGQKFIKKADQTEGWTLNATLGSVEVIADKSAPAEKKDDLPW